MVCRSTLLVKKAILRFVEDRPAGVVLRDGSWCLDATTAELAWWLSVYAAAVGIDVERPGCRWPRSPARLSTTLRALIPTLRSHHVELVPPRGRKHGRRWTLIVPGATYQRAPSPRTLPPYGAHA